MLAYCFKPRLSTQPMRDLSVFLETRSSCVSFGGPFSFAECKPLRDGRTMTVVPGSSISGFTNAAKGSVDYGPPATGTATASFHAHRISAHTAVIQVRGEIDLMSANAFRDFLTYHVAADRTLVVDLSELEFMGTCGLSVLSVLSTRSRDVGGTLALVCARPVQRLLKAAGQESMFACYESLDHAIGLEETRRFPA
ncbi:MULTISPECIES: STAS domain-containing protein [Rhodococcus]|uniref:STAS domain-containing protein n=2 Tax=Rhodococcus TaxID=1827 RepID=UPI003003766E